MPLFTCKFTNNTNLSVQMGLFGKDHEYRTADPLGPHSSETTDGENLINGGSRVAAAFDSATGIVLATNTTDISINTLISLRQNTNGVCRIEFAGLV